MKPILGIIVLAFSFHTLAQSRSAFLQLRAIVPEKTTVKVSTSGRGPTVQLETNSSPNSPQLTKVTLTKLSHPKFNHSYLVSVTHP